MNKFVSEVTDETFEQEVLKSAQPVLVDFWAEWCGPCRALAPAVDAVAEDYSGKAKVVKLNVDFSPNVPARYGIRGIPTLILFKGGDEADRVIGMTSKDNIARMIDQAIGA
ncbi:MAG: thioredoxin [Acidobacteriota bacterium]